MNSLFLPPSASEHIARDIEVTWVSGDTCECVALEHVLEWLTEPWQLIVPVEVVTACAVELPKTRGRWLRQALPFAVEEQLAEDVENLHLAVGAQLADGRHRVMAVNKNWLSQWLSLFPAAPSAIYVDADLLPAEGSQLCWVQGRWLLGGEGEARVALSDEDWLIVKDLCASDVHAYGPEGKRLAGVQHYSLMLEPERWLTTNLGSCNLAQAEFASGASSKVLTRFKPLAVVAAVCLGLQVLFNTAQAWYWEKEAQTYQAASLALYQSLFPQDVRIVNLKAQFDQHLAQDAGRDLLQVLQNLASAEGIRIEGLRLTDQTLRLSTLAPSMAELEEARAQLEVQGVPVELFAPKAQGAGVSAELIVGEQG